jgi:hypothetical protein
MKGIPAIKEQNTGTRGMSIGMYPIMHITKNELKQMVIKTPTCIRSFVSIFLFISYLQSERIGKARRWAYAKAGHISYLAHIKAEPQGKRA